jgi:Asp/Glu/hydantoin racemase
MREMWPSLIDRQRGGFHVYGFRLGILMHETSRFARLPGDVGNANSWEFPVMYMVVDGVTAHDLMVRNDLEQTNRLVDASRALEAQGVRAIVGGCGFLARYQHDIAEAVTIPVVTSSLVQVPMVQTLIGPHRRVGILTAHGGILGEDAFEGWGWAVSGASVLIEGLEDSTYFSGTVRGKMPSVDVETLETEVVHAAKRLRDSHDDVGAIVFECTNLGPFARSVQAATGLPVFDVITLGTMVGRAVLRERFAGDL